MEMNSTIASLDVGQSLLKAWNTVKVNIFLFAGFTVLYYMTYCLLSFFPYIGGLVMFFSFIQIASVFAANHAYEQDKQLEFNDFFRWSPRFSRLFLGNLLVAGILLAYFVLLFVCIFFIIGAGAITSVMNNPQDFTALLSTGLMLFFVAAFIIGIVLSVWLFAYPYIIQFTDIPLSDALSLSWKIGRNNIGQLILFVLLAIGLSILGCLLLLIGLFVTIPLIMATQFYFLRSIFPAEEKESWDFMKSTGNNL